MATIAIASDSIIHAIARLITRRPFLMFIHRPFHAFSRGAERDAMTCAYFFISAMPRMLY